MSLAPDRIADGTIGIGRLFTSAGVDPYDEIVWDRRDARITNWLDGSVAFEQLGVEFPTTWSLNATNIVAQKYFRGTLGTPEREWSLKQVVDRIVDTITDWGTADGYFDGDEAEAFRAELKYILVTQRAAFNSPVWFNIGVRGVPQQASACFILAVDDEMPSILNWYREEGLIFKGGSGAGVNLSRIRSSFEPLEGGGTASGPVSFMRGADASAGTIKSGGKTRRAAKMVILDADHPDIEQFVWAKAIEERKARVLSEAGFEMGLDGADAFSVQYQNANNSVRVTDEFMQAAVDDADWELTSVTTGEVLRTVKARQLWREIAEAAWECADPGLQFDTTINRWHTAPNHGRITASNPCFTGDSRVHTDKGLIRFDELFARASTGEEFRVWTHDATNVEAPVQEMHLTTPDAFMITGKNPIQRLRFSNGMELRCTPSHRIFTLDRGYVQAGDLTPDDRVRSLDLPAPARAAEWAVPVASDRDHYRSKGDRDLPLQLPEVWTDRFAHYLGWLIGDGSTSGSSTVTIYGSADDRQEILPVHHRLLEEINDDRPIKLSEQDNGTVQLRLTRRALKEYLEALGVRSVTGEHKTVPSSIEQAPSEIVAVFLRGLFDADGCAVLNPKKGSYVGLGSISIELLRGVQRLLSTFGISSRIDNAHASFDLRITGGSLHRFAAEIGFSLTRKAATLHSAIVDHVVDDVDTSIRLVERSAEGVELTYNLSEPRNHSYVVNGIVVRNCSEYFHVDNSACNLASINLLKYLQDDGGFDVGAFSHTVDTVFTAQEILVGRADYPTEKIGDTTRALRQLGLGYANLGALLMALGLPYDSDDGRAWAAAITSLMTGSAYAASARTAARVGPFDGFTDDADAMLHVLEMHQDANDRLGENDALPEELVDAAMDAWERTLRDARRHGVRNSQSTVLAPTGCLVGGTMVATSNGLVRLRSLGDPNGPEWQPTEFDVATDHGPRAATQFFVNGAAPVVSVTTERGYQVAGTTTHRIKVVGPDNEWQWKRFADLEPGDLVPLSMDQIVGAHREVRLPLLSEKMAWAGEWHLVVPEMVDQELALLVGYFMGDGSLHSRGLRFCVSSGDADVVDVLIRAAKSLFNVEAAVKDQGGHTEVCYHSTRLVEWWSAAGFAKLPPHSGHQGKGYIARIPDALLSTNDPEVYRAFLRGLFEADGAATGGYPSWTTTSIEFSRDVQRLLLALGFVTTRRECTSGMGSRLHVLRLLNRESNVRWSEEVGFISARKASGVHLEQATQSARFDHLPVSRELIERAVPTNGRNRRRALSEFRRSGSITRRLALDILDERDDEELRRLTGFFFDRVDQVVLGDDELTYDLSVPENLTYVANGFVSHNTIGLAMDCDTTGIEPDLALVKTKRLVGGGTMSIVNQTIPRALRRLGYIPGEVDDIVAYIDEHMSVIGAPHLRPEHLSVFACSMGDNTIHYEGHIRMMGAVQPFLSGGISKTANMPEDATVDDVEGLHMLAWELGLKSVAIYRDNCKLGQPLSSSKAKELAAPEVEIGEIVERVIHHPVRQKMSRTRRSRTFEFRVADCKGFATIGEYDDGQPGEIFLTVSKQGSTMAGVMDAFAKSVSYGLQYGVPLRAFVEAFTNMRFEPAGMTDDPDIRFASSIMDYLFRRLAIEYMTYDERAELGIFSVDERLQPTLPGVEEQVTHTSQGTDLPPDPKSSTLFDEPIGVRSTPSEVRPANSDAPMCMTCGISMIRSGSCYVCTSCGSTSGCS